MFFLDLYLTKPEVFCILKITKIIKKVNFSMEKFFYFFANLSRKILIKIFSVNIKCGLNAREFLDLRKVSRKDLRTDFSPFRTSTPSFSGSN